MTDDHDHNGRTVAEIQRALIAKAREQTRENRSNAGTPIGAPSPLEVGDAASETSDPAASVAFDPSSPGPPHDSFTGYQILGELHRGGQGIVYQAIQKSTQRKVAIKVMREGPFASATDKARFDREVQILGQLKHPNIVAIHGTGMAAGHYYFVMDYIHGQPLDVFIAGRRHSIDDILRLFAKICDTISAAHLRGVIHRDLKPTNIRIDDEGEPHILDFGLAKSAPGDTDASVMTVTGQFIGSLPWASPEQAEGVPGAIDIRTDVYSLGVMLYQMLTGSFPYQIVGSMRDVLENILRVTPVRPGTIRREINDEVETILLKCLEKERDRRYQSAGELARDIRHYLNGEPIEAKRDSAWYVLRKQLRKYRLPVAIVTVFVFLVTVGLIVTATAWRKAAAQRDVAHAAHDEADRERDTAEEARRQAEAVTDFLVGMLASSNPYSSQGPNATIGEILKSASGRVEESFKDQPLVEAKLYSTLFETYDALGLSSDAQGAAQKALELRQEWLPPDHPDIALSLRLCSQAAARMAKYGEAEAFARQSLDNCQRRFGPKHKDVAESLTSLGVALGAQGRYADAEPVLREAAELYQELYGTKHAATINAGFRYACCLLEQGRLDEAGPLLEQSVGLGREALGPEHPELANMLSSLGELRHFSGNLEAAEAAYREALAIRLKVFGDEHITIANSVNIIAFLLVDEERFEEAEQLYRQSLEMRRRLYGPRRIEVTFALNGLARLYLRTERPLEAEALLRESLDIFDEKHPTHWRRGYAECLLGAALTMQGRHDEAEPPIIHGLSIVRAARGDGDPFSREVLQYAIDLYDAWGKPDQAAQYRLPLQSQ